MLNFAEAANLHPNMLRCNKFWELTLGIFIRSIDSTYDMFDLYLNAACVLKKPRIFTICTLFALDFMPVFLL